MRNGFTLIELLVVVTIIVVLLALLAPALDKAIYQAELAVCGTNLHAIGSGATVYTADHKRFYPARKQTYSTTGNGPPELLSKPGDGAQNDDRPTFRPYMPINAFSDPLAKRLNLNAPPVGSIVWGGYSLWFGWGYISQTAAGVVTIGTRTRAMRKVGDKMEWGGHGFSALAGDYDLIAPIHSLMHGAHPDTAYGEGITYLTTVDDMTGKVSWWENLKGQYERAPIDMNYVMQDGSVDRLTKVTWDEGKAGGERGERVARVPEYPLQQGYDAGESRWIHIPVR